MLTRRTALSGLAAIASANLLATRGARAQDAHVVRTDADWRSTLTPDQYAVLRKEGTERPFTSPLLHEERKGIFACAGCELRPVFILDQVRQRHRLAELLGAAGQCGRHPRGQLVGHDPHGGALAVDASGHLGHVFDDGPKPTGLRYCMNGVALTFKPATA